MRHHRLQCLHGPAVQPGLFPLLGKEGKLRIELVLNLAVQRAAKPLPRSLEICVICLNSICGLYIPCPVSLGCFYMVKLK